MTCSQCSFEFCWCCLGSYTNYRHDSEISSQLCSTISLIKTFIYLMVVLMVVIFVIYRLDINIQSIFAIPIRVCFYKVLDFPIIKLGIDVIASEALLMSVFLQTNFIIVGFRYSVGNILNKRLIRKGVIFRFGILTILSPICSILQDGFYVMSFLICCFVAWILIRFTWMLIFKTSQSANLSKFGESVRLMCKLYRIEV